MAVRREAGIVAGKKDTEVVRGGESDADSDTDDDDDEHSDNHHNSSVYVHTSSDVMVIGDIIVVPVSILPSTMLLATSLTHFSECVFAMSEFASAKDNVGVAVATVPALL